jgi:hypothetical protein
MKNIRTRYSSVPPKHPDLKPERRGGIRISVLAAMMLLLLSYGPAQSLIVKGTVNNNGTLRVKKQTLVTQPAIGGTFELFDADQVLPAKQYGSVRLSGTGVNTTSGGSFSISKSLTIAAPVTLDITKGTVITLGDTLFEAGILKGAIQKTVNLSGATTQSDFGQIGATIAWSVAAPETTTVIRASDSTQFGRGNQSIRRYYDVQLSDATKTGNVTFKYADSELNGHDVNLLLLWRSTDNGENWVRHEPVVDAQLRTLSAASVPLKGLWTAADTLRALGPMNGAAGIPAVLASASTLDSLPIVFTTLDTLKVKVTDVFGAPVANVPVDFVISSRPTALLDGMLSVILDSTDALGIARTVFTIGSKVGQYRVIATSPGLNDTVTVITTAQHGAPESVLAEALPVQTRPILTALDTAFTVTVLDSGGNAVKNALVEFFIDSIPSIFAVDTDLSDDTVRTDSAGRATTILTLGSKVGTYGVSAIVTDVDTARFYAVARAGAAVRIAANSATTMQGIVGTNTDPLEVALFDIGDNPVDNDTVTFKIAQFPLGSDTGRLSMTKVPTDPLGRASTILTLGTKVGLYTVGAENPNVGTPSAFNVTAEPAAPKTVAEISGNNQISPILTSLPTDFVVAVYDTFGNAVDSAMVVFRIDSINANGFGARLSVDSMQADLSGIASTRLTLGSKTGKYRVNATVNDVPVLILEAHASAGAAMAMIPTNGVDQLDTIQAPLGQLFTVRVTDIGGNGVDRKAVQFNISQRPDLDTTAMLSDSTGITDSLGFASTRLTLGSKVGMYAVKAAVITPAGAVEAVNIGKKKGTQAAVSAVIETTFTAQAKHGSAAMMQMVFGDRQINPTESELDTAFVVSVRDRGDNPVLTDTVRFAVIAAPENASQQAVVDSLVPVDSAGAAKTFLRLGTREGVYTVRASVPNGTSTLFSANAYFLYGDINKDIDINVADITSLVDILNKKITPSASDSAKADFNRDALIDDKDIEKIRETILDRSIFTNSVQPAAFLEESNNAEYVAPVVSVKRKYSAVAKTILEATSYGLRVNLTNDEPVRGIELRLHLKDSTLVVNKINMLFKRAEMMDVFVSTKDREVRVVAYNLSNTEILPDSGSIFRLPFITDLNMIDTTEVTIALRSNAAAPVNTETITAPVDAYPVTFRLSQNYPNPFNGSTTIEYDIPDGSELTKTVIQVFNILGQRVKTLVAEEQQPGRYSVRWDGTDQNGTSVSSGVYFYRLISKSHVGSRKMLYVK